GRGRRSIRRERGSFPRRTWTPLSKGNIPAGQAIMKPGVILVTGCSSGIGRATAIEAAARGHRVFASGRRMSDLSDLAVRGIDTLAVDVTDEASVTRGVAAVLSGAGRIDALVNNAGFGQYGAIEDVSEAEWRRQFDVN